MKAISAHITGFYRSSFHAYTTEVNVDGHRWRLGLRYSKFHDFYDQLVAAEKDFHAEFPPKGTLFFTPKPGERQEQLETFLQQVLAFYAAKGYPTEIEDLLCDLLKVPRHLRSPEHEDDDVSTSTESILDEPMHEPLSSSDSIASIENVMPKEAVNKGPVADAEGQQTPEEEYPVVKEEEKVVIASKPDLPATPVANKARPVEEVEASITHDEAEVEVETPASAEETEATQETAEDVAKETVEEKEDEPIAAQIPAEEPILQTNADEDEADAEVVEQAAQIVDQEEPKVEEQPVVEPVAQVDVPAPTEPQTTEERVVNEISSLKQEDVESKELASSGRLSSWITALLPKSLLGFIRRRCLKKTNLVVLCVALLLPMVLARR
ncbi:hypothetical protein V7S43_013999 [Phytophthora oleae]|uniref:PX domain-containing protein n=1 Tax=Phytophthora oleae TaxID=2107226 RepID=A0ABD3F677_9STRA